MGQQHPVKGLPQSPCSSGDSRRLPRRLIDLDHFGPGTLDACVFTTDNQDINYAALSYYWGTSDIPAYVTTSTNFDGMLHVLRYAKMPLTFQHAFQICRKLDLRYLWVDATYIIQDSTVDRHPEARNMAGGPPEFCGNFASLGLLFGNCSCG